MGEKKHINKIRPENPGTIPRNFVDVFLLYLNFDLSTQCEIPPHSAQYPFETVSQRGHRTRLAFFQRVLSKHRLRYPFCTGGIAHQVRMLGRGVSHPIWSCRDTQTP